jgi:anti-anti-sigma factor
MTVEKDPVTDATVLDEGAVGARTPPLEIVVRRVVGRTQVVVAGELDDSTAGILRERLVQVTANLVGDLVLDIGLLTFVDSTGLALFVAQHKKLQSTGSNLIIVSPSPMARRLFEITGLSQILAIEPPD